MKNVYYSFYYNKNRTITTKFLDCETYNFEIWYVFFFQLPVGLVRKYPLLSSHEIVRSKSLQISSPSKLQLGREMNPVVFLSRKNVVCWSNKVGRPIHLDDISITFARRIWEVLNILWMWMRGSLLNGTLYVRISLPSRTSLHNKMYTVVDTRHKMYTVVDFK